MKKEKIFQEEKKVMKKKIIAAFLTTAMTIGSLSGVTVFAADAGTDEKVEMADASDVDGTTITFWHSMGGVNGEAIDTLVKKFNDENEYGITVDAQYQGLKLRFSPCRIRISAACRRARPLRRRRCCTC